MLEQKQQGEEDYEKGDERRKFAVFLKAMFWLVVAWLVAKFLF